MVAGLLFLFVDGFFVFPWHNTKMNPIAVSQALWGFFNGCPVDSTNLETARPVSQVLSTFHFGHDTLEVWEETAGGLELSLLIRSHQQLSYKISCTEAANRQEPETPKNDPGTAMHAVRFWRLHLCPFGKTGKALEIWSSLGSTTASSDSLFPVYLFFIGKVISITFYPNIMAQLLMRLGKQDSFLQLGNTRAFTVLLESQWAPFHLQLPSPALGRTRGEPLTHKVIDP